MIDEQTAELEFQRFIDLNDLDVSTKDEDFSSSKTKIVRAIMSGKLTIDDDGLPELVCKNGENVKFHRPTGAMYTAMDVSKGGDFKKLFASIAQVTQQTILGITKLDARDVNMLICLHKFFLVQ